MALKSLIYGQNKPQVILGEPNLYKVMVQSLWENIARTTVEQWCLKMNIPLPDVSLYIVLRV